jgi:hypothetical protein
MGGGIGRRIEYPTVRNKRFVFLTRNNCKPRLWTMLTLEVYCNARPLVLRSTYKSEKMVEVAMRLSQENLHKGISFIFQKVDLNGYLPDVLKAQCVRAPELSSVLTLVHCLCWAAE